jgi:hypothetical protein
LLSVYLSATNGNRFMEAVIKVERKPTSGLKHIGRNSMPIIGMRQESLFAITFKYNYWFEEIHHVLHPQN